MVKNPLGSEHCACLNKVLESYGPSMELARACKDCGMNVDDIIDQLNTQKELATRAKARFFPQEP